MKLSKSQRLFVKVGCVTNEIAYWKWVDTCDAVDCSDQIAELKKKRKKLIREAVLAYESELKDAYNNGWRDGFWDE